MRPYRISLDRYHATEPHDEVEQAVWSYLGEGVADDLLQWLCRVADNETATFIYSVIADEENHEAMATAELRRLLAGNRGHRKAERAARRMRAIGLGPLGLRPPPGLAILFTPSVPAKAG